MQIIAVGMHQYRLDMVGIEPLQAAFDGETGVFGAEVKCRLAVDKVLAHLADDDPVLALAFKQAAQPLFADAVGGGGIQQVDTQTPCQRQQFQGAFIVRQVKTGRIFYALVATQLDRTQSQRRYQRAVIAKAAIKIVQGDHVNRCSQGARPIGGRGSESAAGCWPGRMPCLSSSDNTRSARSGANASLVGQPVHSVPAPAARKALSGRTSPRCAGSARLMRSVRHCRADWSSQGIRLASSFCAKAICAASSRATPSASARLPPRYQAHWPSGVGWVVMVIRGLLPPPRQWA